MEEYLKEYIGECAEILDTNEMIYIGSDFPDEYAHSKDTKVLRGPNEYAKANATVAIKELIQIAANKAFSENHKDKHNSKAKYGWYRYDTRFAIPKYDHDGELAGYNIFKGRLVIKHAQDGKLYLYDILRIKKKRVSRLSKNCTVVKLISCLVYYNKTVWLSIRILEKVCACSRYRDCYIINKIIITHFSRHFLREMSILIYNGIMRKLRSNFRILQII